MAASRQLASPRRSRVSNIRLEAVGTRRRAASGAARLGGGSLKFEGGGTPPRRDAGCASAAAAPAVTPLTAELGPFHLQPIGAQVVISAG